ncbi:AIR synthase-related protein [Desulfurococcus mucosus]|uniref:AIR synthase-related protein n=1 Tax=Desulfurococcus mucosus TaxID=2275 RepID=UPI00064F9E61|nr:AIR synthase-related protein [Desulfurococcus mucosus]
MVKHGKPSWNTMSFLLSLLPIEDPDLVVGPRQGEDAAVLRLRDGFLVAHVDPITTGVRKAGYLAVHVAGNDIAVRGVAPRWFMPVTLIPAHYSEADVEELFRDMGAALREIGGVAIGGHTEVTPGLDRPIIAMTAIGYTNGRVISTRDAREGDHVVIIGRIGGEGAGVIAWDFEDLLLGKGVPENIIKRAKGFIYDVSIVKTALAVKDYVNTMHDATEGGVIQALREVASASGKDIIVDADAFQIEKEVEEISQRIGVNPLRLLSSGCIVASVHPGNLDALLSRLRGLGVGFSVVGHVVKGGGRVIVESKSGGRIVVDTDVVDEIYKLWNQ